MQSRIRIAIGPASTAPAKTLRGFNVESVRVEGERVVAGRVAAHPLYRRLEATVVPSDPGRVRRQLLANALRLTDTMAPDAYRAARLAQRTLAISGDLEIFQRGGGENACIHLVEAPILLEIQGHLLPLLDEAALIGVFGHELGHFLAHGPTSPLARPHAVTAAVGQPGVDAALERDLLSLSMFAELTADRVGLLACQDLHAMLRLEMITLTGLSGEVLTWDTQAYLAQCRELMESVVNGSESAYGGTHPEHSLRAYALWLFSETKIYRQLTGRGPGTRTLQDVDATLAKALQCGGGADPGYHMLDEPPRDLHECALAASVIVAYADDLLADEEAEAIERIFAPLVGDWREYLNYDFALTRFRQTAQVVGAAGGDLIRALFNLLVHVMGADGIVDRDEVRAIVAIGQELGRGPEFRKLLTSTLSALQVDIDAEKADPIPLPLPPGKAEVTDALDCFLDGTVRRGESVITLRRLLRLLGKQRPDPQAIQTLEASMTRRMIHADHNLAQVELDQRLHLIAPVEVDDEPEQVELPPDAETRTGLIRALTRLRDLLVSGDGRSPSVRLRRMRRGRTFDLFRLDAVTVGRAERCLAQVSGSKATTFIRTAESGTHDRALSCTKDLVALARENRSRIEEKGTNDLYLGYPLLTGNIGVDGKSTTYLVRAPLVLFPVDLVEIAKGARGFDGVPRKDETPIVNQSLLRLVFNKKGLAFSDELSDELDALAGDPAGGVPAVLRKIAEVGLKVSHQPGTLHVFKDRNEEFDGRGTFLEIEESAVLGIFPQSNSDLLQDYNGLISDLSKNLDLEKALAAAQVLLPDSLQTRSARARGPAKPAAPPVVSADPSQRAVVDECRANEATVVDGPPGTGKSQVIVNLVADALRRGERVAVVCEKRAALDVVSQRLEVLGLRKLLGVVHDVHEDRRDLFDQIDKRISQYSPAPFDRGEYDQTALAHKQTDGALRKRSQLLQDTNGGQLTVGELASLAAGIDVAPPDADLTSLSLAQIRELSDSLIALHSLQDVWAPGTYWRPKGSERATFEKWSEDELAHADAQLANAIAAAEAYAAETAQCDASGELVEQAEQALRAAQQLRTRPDEEVFRTLVDVSAADASKLALAPEAAAEWAKSSEALIALDTRVDLEADAPTIAAVSIVERWTGRFLRFFVWAWWKSRGVVRRFLAAKWPQKAGTPFSKEFLRDISNRIAATAAWTRATDAMQQLRLGDRLPAKATEAEAFIQQTGEMASAVQQLAGLRESLTEADAWVGDDLAEWDRRVDQRLRLIERRRALSTAMKPLRASFPWLAEYPNSTDLESFRAQFSAAGTQLIEADVLRARAASSLPTAPNIFDAVAAGLPESPADDWSASLARGWAEGLLRKVEAQQPDLKRVGTHRDDEDRKKESARLAELDVEIGELEVEWVLRRADEAGLLRIPDAEKRKRRTPEQKLKEEILKEVRKKRRVMPLRSFVRRYASRGLLDVVPVWLLSPETMAILFPREPLFDLVVFDEASQCTVESGFPVLLRAKRVVIAGDEKQMPPSSYFSLSSSDDDAPPPETEEERQLRDVLTAESLLTLARSRVEHTGLNWHYRCRHEPLIAFSNHAMYHGRLLTIPSTAGPSAPSAIQWVAVGNGEYNKGENRPEAEKVVDVLIELLQRESSPSVGVITFNLRQRKAIMDVIDTRCGADEAFARLWDEANSRSVDERPFIKNLESVQGDERDVIIFSLGHAPRQRKSGELYVPARFGPLGQRGGERRLNVAISRAKQECIIVASFKPDQLSVATTKNEGPKLFKQFLEFAWNMSHGLRAQADHVLDLVREARQSPHHQRKKSPLPHALPLPAQIALALEQERVPFEMDVGTSELRVPLGILDPKDPSRFRAAILTDEGTEEMTPFERHVHRPAVLKLRGWATMYVSSLSWLRRRDEILNNIFELVPGCRGALDTEVWKIHLDQAKAKSLEHRPAKPRPKPIAASTARAPQPTAEIDWTQCIPDPQFRAAFIKLDEQGALTHVELANLVGGPRRARKFAAAIAEYLKLLPFDVKTKGSGTDARYEKV